MRRIKDMHSILEELSQAITKGNHEDSVRLVKEALRANIHPVDILEKGMVPGIQALEELFKNGQVFLPEILISVRAMNKGRDELKPHLMSAEILKKGTVVLGTVEGDLHDIGKNLVGMMLECNGYKVVDLGVDVNANLLMSTARENEADIVAISGLLTSTIFHFKRVVDLLEKVGLKGKLKVMIGGAPVTRAYADEIGAEGFAENCVTAVDEADRLMAIP
jgi:5-methyltetrahydrofolate--homocysteine methyltransferase